MKDKSNPSWWKLAARPFVLSLVLKGFLLFFVTYMVNDILYTFKIQKIDEQRRRENFEMMIRNLKNHYSNSSESIDLKALERDVEQFFTHNVINAYRVNHEDIIISYQLINQMDVLFDRQWPAASRSIASIDQTQGPSITGQVPSRPSPTPNADYLENEKWVFAKLNFARNTVGVLLTFFKPSPWKGYFAGLMYQIKPVMIDLFGVFIILLIYIVLARKEFILLFQELSSVSGGDLHGLKLSSPEGTGLRNFASTLTTRVGQLQATQKETLAQVLPGKLFIMDLYKKEVTSFDGAIIRMDLNGYTKNLNFLDKSDEEKMLFESEFHRWGNAVCEKFEAKVYEFVGDEFIILIEARESLDYRLEALHLVRCAFEDLYILNRKLETLKLSQLTVKATFITGTLNIKQQEGLILIESKPMVLTSRIISNVNQEEKKKSQLVLFEEDAKSLLEHGDFSEVFKVKFKQGDNFPSMYARKVNHIYSWMDYLNKNQLLEHTIYLRSENDLIQNLNKISLEMLSSLNGQINIALIEVFWRTFSKMKILNPSAELLNALEVMIDRALAELSTNLNSENFIRTFSRLISIVPKFYLNSKDRHKVVYLLSQSMQSSNSQISARAREAIYKLEPSNIILMNFLNSSNHRAAVDSLIDLAKKDGLNPFLLMKLESWGDGNNFEFTRSSLYAIYEISSYFKHQKPEYFATNEGFEKLKELMFRFKDSNEPGYQKWVQRFINEI